jgi:ectoine hydroxylase-related dioxygenase (phytanoyl-CoA dioxygenase family)
MSGGPRASDGAALGESFEREGYVVIDSEISETVLDGAVADLDGEYVQEGGAESLRRRLARRIARRPKVTASYRDEIRVQDAWLGSRNVRAIALAPAVIAVLSELYGRRPLPFQTLNFRVGTQQAPHSDTIHFNSKPPGFMCGVWVALEDTDPDNGPLVYFPGSHKLREVTPQTVGAPLGPQGYAAYEEYIRNTIEQEGLVPQYGLLRRGQALIWAANLLHGGATQRDLQRTRLSQVTHYFFEDCRYWTPMASDESHTEWREPNWVR